MDTDMPSGAYSFETPNLIGSTWCAGNAGTGSQMIDPATGEPTGTVSFADAAQVAAAADAAAAAFPAWAATSPWDRRAVLMKCAETVAARKADMAALITQEMGKPLAEAMGEMDRCVETLQWCAEEAIRIYGRALPPRAPGVHEYTIKRPVGVVAAFSPWNFPAVLLLRKLAAGMAAGCTVVCKPAQKSPSIGAALVQACLDAGVPDGVLQMVVGHAPMVADTLVRHPAVEKISLTGSVAAGRAVGALAGEMLKAATLELGGHAPVVVDNTVDVSAAATQCAAFKYRNAGQVCIAPTRFYVHDEIRDDFVDAFIAAAEKLVVGPGTDDATTMGPLATESGLSGIDGFVQDAVRRGATLKTGGSRIGNHGYFFQPTVIADVPDDADIMIDEPFGPVAPINGWSSLDDVMVRANGNPFGLAAYAFTREAATAARFREQVQAGWIGINSFTPAMAEMPLSGMKTSGVGYEGGPEGLDSYMQISFVSHHAGAPAD